MKPLLFALMTLSLLLVGGCITPVSKLMLPPVTTIKGTVSQLDDNGFMLTDASGSIFIQARLPEQKLNLANGETVTVFGNLRGGSPARVFDGYVIRKTSGEQIIISRPQPHIGFVLQTSFR
ncbi:MAG: hypothetical protein R3292_13015 [Alcanivorax sp.]|nr:hypothetical protein [Alcanivorax sp.]